MYVTVHLFTTKVYIYVYLLKHSFATGLDNMFNYLLQLNQ